MRKKYNRNTFTVSNNGHNIQSSLEQVFQKPPPAALNMSSSQKKFLSLQLLQKCSQKVFQFKEQQYSLIIKDQTDCNSILSRIKIDTRKIAKDMKEQERQRFFQDGIILQRRRKIKKSQIQKPISSWTAFENLDITYKSREEDLTRENVDLIKKIENIENKLRSLHKHPASISANLLHGTNSFPNLSNLQKIELRIQNHQLLIKKLKQKIQQKKQSKDQLKDMSVELVIKARHKYGEEIADRVKQMLEKMRREEC